MVITSYLSGHSTIVGEVKIIMVLTPYLSDLSTIIERSQYHIGFSIKSGLSTILKGVISRTIIYSAILNRTGELGCFILQAHGC